MGALGLRAFSSPDAITACYNWADDRLVTSFENSDGLQNLAFYLSPQVEVIPDWVMMSGTLQYKAERMKGRGYRHYNHNWSGGVTAVVQHWGFNLMAQYQKSESSLFGEKLTWGESYSVVSLGYGRDNWEIAAGVYCPFTKYDQGARLYNRYNTNEMHLRIDMAPMPFLQFSYNLQWGRQKRGAGKLVNVDAGVEKLHDVNLGFYKKRCGRAVLCSAPASCLCECGYDCYQAAEHFNAEADKYQRAVVRFHLLLLQGCMSVGLVVAVISVFEYISDNQPDCKYNYAKPKPKHDRKNLNL